MYEINYFYLHQSITVWARLVQFNGDYRVLGIIITSNTRSCNWSNYF